MYAEYEILLSTINALAKTYIISFITNKNLDASAVCQLKVPRQVGLCLSCKVLEDESHLLLQCKTNDILRIYKLTSNSKNGKCCLYTQGIIRLVVNVKTLPLLIRYIYYWNLHFLICVIIPRARVTMAALLVVLLSKNLWVACLSSLFRFWAYLMQIVQQVRRARWVWCLRYLPQNILRKNWIWLE